MHLTPHAFFKKCWSFTDFELMCSYLTEVCDLCAEEIVRKPKHSRVKREMLLEEDCIVDEGEKMLMKAPLVMKVTMICILVKVIRYIS